MNDGLAQVGSQDLTTARPPLRRLFIGESNFLPATVGMEDVAVAEAKARSSARSAPAVATVTRSLTTRPSACALPTAGFQARTASRDRDRSGVRSERCRQCCRPPTARDRAEGAVECRHPPPRAASVRLPGRSRTGSLFESWSLSDLSRTRAWGHPSRLVASRRADPVGALFVSLVVSTPSGGRCRCAASEPTRTMTTTRAMATRCSSIPSNTLYTWASSPRHSSAGLPVALRQYQGSGARSWSSSCCHSDQCAGTSYAWMVLRPPWPDQRGAVERLIERSLRPSTRRSRLHRMTTSCCPT